MATAAQTTIRCTNNHTCPCTHGSRTGARALVERALGLGQLPLERLDLAGLPNLELRGRLRLAADPAHFFRDIHFFVLPSEDHGTVAGRVGWV